VFLSEVTGTGGHEKSQIIKFPDRVIQIKCLDRVILGDPVSALVGNITLSGVFDSIVIQQLVNHEF